MSADPLAELQDRIAISEVLHRYAAAIDGKDWALLRSCFTDDLEADFRSFGGLEVVRGADAWVAAIRSTIQGMDATQHLTGNHTHRLDGDQAKLSADVQAVHILANQSGDNEYTIGGSYDCDLVRTAEGWRIRRYVLKVRWHRGNRHIIRLATRAAKG